MNINFFTRLKRISAFIFRLRLLCVFRCLQTMQFLTYDALSYVHLRFEHQHGCHRCLIPRLKVSVFKGKLRVKLRLGSIPRHNSNHFTVETSAKAGESSIDGNKYM